MNRIIPDAAADGGTYIVVFDAKGDGDWQPLAIDPQFASVADAATLVRTITVTVTDRLGDRAAEPWSRVHRHEDEHGEFYVFTCSDGAHGREWADPDEAELERLAHHDTHVGCVR